MNYVKLHGHQWNFSLYTYKQNMCSVLHICIETSYSLSSDVPVVIFVCGKIPRHTIFFQLSIQFHDFQIYVYLYCWSSSFLSLFIIQAFIWNIFKKLWQVFDIKKKKKRRAIMGEETIRKYDDLKKRIILAFISSDPIIL